MLRIDLDGQYRGEREWHNYLVSTARTEGQSHRESPVFCGEISCVIILLLWGWVCYIPDKAGSIDATAIGCCVRSGRSFDCLRCSARIRSGALIIWESKLANAV